LAEYVEHESYRKMIGKREGKRSLREPSRAWVSNVMMDLTK
jgi:hypothetical protein